VDKMDAIENSKPADLEPLVAEIVSSYVRKNHVAPDQISLVIETVYQSLVALGKPVAPARTPAVPIRQSVTRNYNHLSGLWLAGTDTQPAYPSQAWL